jgi:hypothetical protein
MDDTPDFLNSGESVNSQEIRTKLDIVRRVIEVKLAEAEQAEKAKAIAEDRQLLIDILHEKKLEQKKGMTVEGLELALLSAAPRDR